MGRSRLIILGAGGYARCVADAAVLAGFEIDSFVDRSVPEERRLLGRPVVAEAHLLDGRLQASQLVVAIGDNHLRQTIVDRLSRRTPQLTFPTIVHPRAVVSTSAILAEGAVLLANVVVNPQASVGAHASLYSNAVVEHDDVVGDYVTLAPAAALGGAVRIGRRSFIGLGAVINHNIMLGDDCVVGSGAAVINDVPDGGVVVGVPGRVRRLRRPGEQYL